MAGRRALRHGARRGFRVSGPAVQIAVGDRARHHRHALERACSSSASRTGEARHEEADRPQAPLRGLHPQVERGRPRAGVQLASTPSARPARPTSPARRPRAGCWCPTATTTAASPAPRWSGRRCKRLLADIEAGRVDVVVVYKIDRLSRALMDFAKLVEVFDRNNVTFVSVTQSFNTTTSMGRLTLNILLSLRPVRARGDRRAHPRQVRRLPQEGHVDGRLRAARLRRQGPQAGRQRGRGRDRSDDLRALHCKIGSATDAGARASGRGRDAASAAS